MNVEEASSEVADELSLPALLADLSSRCAQAATDQIDSALDECQRLLCEHLTVDRCELWLADEEADDSGSLTQLQDQARCSLARRRPAVSRLTNLNPDVHYHDLPLSAEVKALFPWIFNRARRGNAVVISRLDELPAEALRDREMLAREGVRSAVFVPLSAGGQWLGVLAFGMKSEVRYWTGGEVKVIHLSADMFASALSRVRLERALREAELRLRVTAAGAEADVWTLTLGSGQPMLGHNGGNLLNLPSEEPSKYERFLSQVHPDDLNGVRSALKTASETGVEVAIEYRVILPGDECRWISSRWHPIRPGSGATRRLIGACMDVTARKAAEAERRRSAAEIRELNKRLTTECDYVRGEVKLNQRHTAVVGQSRSIRKVLQEVEQVARVNCPVLIGGESGTGKELIAQSIHRLSPRRDRLMITVNCAALPGGLIDSELFGRERGAYTGALSSQPGRFELADQSTIFLDEIAELPMELQGKLLRVLQDGEYARLGNPKTRKVDVRVIAATNRDLGEEVRKQRFREDLFYRLSVFPITLPPLRERVEDIPLLVFAFLDELSSRIGKRITKVPRQVMETLERHYWPGNIRELRNVIERGVILSTGDTLRGALPTQTQGTKKPVTMAEVERQHILSTLEKTDWHIKGPHGAAKVLDLKPGTLYSRMRKLGVPHRRQKDGMPT